MLVLGIHNGHHASCALVRDGTLISAIEQERITRRKHDGQEGLSNRLPIAACLSAASVSLYDVDLIVSSFQAASPGGIGLHRPLVEEGFDLFAPDDPRHWVVSHHRAHAACAFGCSGFQEAAALVCDLGGSTTYDGGDFFLPFEDFRRRVSPTHPSETIRTEALSVYHARGTELELRRREYCVPHNTPDVFIHSVASLYDNVARAIFRTENAHGQLMALASLAKVGSAADVTAHNIVEVRDDGSIVFKNDWQARTYCHRDVLRCAPLAREAQTAFETAILALAQAAQTLTGSRKLVAAGGAFLNILGNSLVARSGYFDDFYVPSAPHDAGISVGCAFVGFWSRSEPSQIPRGKAVDRMGPPYDIRVARASLARRSDQLFVQRINSEAEIAVLLEEGAIVARHSGRSEFGPRALGARSLLASPLRADSKARLNLIKGRQPWRPLAPVICEEALAEYFAGPLESPYMNFVHQIHELHRQSLPALEHADGSTRAQTLRQSDDPSLFALLMEFKRRTGYPILCNTSLNGEREPIVETPEEAIMFFETHGDVDALLIEDLLIRRHPSPSTLPTKPRADTIVSILYPGEGRRITLLIRREISLEICPDTLDLLNCGRPVLAEDLSEGVRNELWQAWRLGLIE